MSHPNTSAAETPLPEPFRRLTELDDAWRTSSAGERLAEIRRAAPRLRERVLDSGRVLCARTFDAVQLPYPTAFGLAGAALSPVPYLVMTNRFNLVQFHVPGPNGGIKTLLFNPTDVERSAETPFFADLRRRMGGPIATWLMTKLRKPSVTERLASVGLRPEDVDYIAFDHLHTQDVRGLLGASGPPSIAAALPRAKLLIWRPELEILRSIHPLQRPWYIEGAVRGVDPDRFRVLEGDTLLGSGVALVRTPGHTVGNWSLVVNTERGVWAVSENGISADSYAPEASAIPGVRSYARREQVELILNANTVEGKNDQYTSMILEKLLVDRCPDAPEFCQHFPSSELTATPLTPGLAPTYHHGTIVSGDVQKPRA